MTLNLNAPETPPELKPRIVVFGIGGAGCNAVGNMISAALEGVECVVANTDAQALNQSTCERKVQLGMSITQGLGAGSRPEIGRAAAEEGMPEITDQLQGAHMVFLTAGMGGGTGTGASPVIAQAAREQGILTVGVVTKPFHFEGAHRMRVAEEGIAGLQEVVDTLIVIPNQNLFRLATERTTFADAFSLADDVLYSGVRGITDLMVMPGLINLDFADIRTVMGEMGKAMMGAGEAEGESRSVEAAEAAISNPLLDDVSMAGAKGLLINITGGSDLTLYEVDEAANRVRDEVDPGANIIFGSAFDESMEGRLRVSVFATGIEAEAVSRPRPAGQPELAATPATAAAANCEPIVAEPVPQPMPQPAPQPSPQPAHQPAPQRAPQRAMPPAAAVEPAADMATVAGADAVADPDDDPEQRDIFSAVPDQAPAQQQDDPTSWLETQNRPHQGAGDGPVHATATAPEHPAGAGDPEPRQSFFGLRLKKRRDEQPDDRARPKAAAEGDRRERIVQRLRGRDPIPEDPTNQNRGTAIKISRPVFSDTDAPEPPAKPAAAPGPDGPDPAGPVVVTAPPVEKAQRGDDNEDEDLLEIPAFLRRQAN